MKTYPAKMYDDERMEEATADEIVKTIKAQCYAKGKSGKWIETKPWGILITHPKLTAMILDDDAIVYYRPSDNTFHGITDNAAFIFEV